MTRPAIDSDTAKRLRTMISHLQAAIMLDPRIPIEAREDLIIIASKEGFGLVDRLAGDIR